MQISPCTLKMRVKGPQNRATCFATFLQNELNNDVACFTTHVQTCLATKEVVVGCEKLLQKVESSCTFCNKIRTCCAFCRSKANLFCNKWHPRLVNMALFVIACFSLNPRFPSFPTLAAALCTSIIQYSPMASLWKPRIAKNGEYGPIILKLLQPSPSLSIATINSVCNFFPFCLYLFSCAFIFQHFFMYVCIGSYTLVFVFYFYHPNHSRRTLKNGP